MNLNDIAVIITGATSGIGRATAIDLAEHGARVVITGRRADRLDALKQEIDDERCVALAGDVLDPDLPQQLIDLCVERFGRCDVVFNNAGVMHVAPIEKTDIDAMCDMIRVNFEAATRMAYTALKHFQRAGSGYLINTSSTLGRKTRPTAGVYSGTKYAIEALTEALRMEVAGSGVRVAVIEPGLTATELQDHFEQHPKDFLGIQQLVDPADIARCLRFMLEQPDHVSIPVMLVQPSEQAM